MKSVKKIIAVAIAVLLIMAVSGIALAAPADTTQAPEQNLIASATSYTIPKDIVVFNAAGMNIFEPNITYSYEVTPAAAGASVTDKDGNKANVKTGIAGGLLIMAEGGTTPASTASLVFGGSDTTAGTATNQEGATITTTSKVVRRNLIASFDVSKFGTMPGIYRYKLTESSTGYAASGVTKGAYQDDRYLDVYVRWNTGKTALEVYGLTMFTSDDTIVYSSSAAAGFKVTGYDVATEGADADTYHTYNFDVTKAVDGGFADKNNEFPFSINITSGAASAVEFYSTGDYANTRITFTGGAFDPNPGLNPTPLALKDTDTVLFVGLPGTAAATVKELDNSPDVYTATAKLNGTTDVTLTNDATARTWTTARAIPVSGTATQYLVVTNTLNEVSPTGVVMRVAPYALMVAAGIALLIVTRRRRQHA